MRSGNNEWGMRNAAEVEEEETKKKPTKNQEVAEESQTLDRERARLL